MYIFHICEKKERKKKRKKKTLEAMEGGGDGKRKMFIDVFFLLLQHLSEIKRTIRRFFSFQDVGVC